MSKIKYKPLSITIFILSLSIIIILLLGFINKNIFIQPQLSSPTCNDVTISRHPSEITTTTLHQLSEGGGPLELPKGTVYNPQNPIHLIWVSMCQLDAMVPCQSELIGAILEDNEDSRCSTECKKQAKNCDGTGAGTNIQPCRPYLGTNLPLNPPEILQCGAWGEVIIHCDCYLTTQYAD